MLKQKNYPYVIFDDNSVMLDYSFESLSFGRDSYLLPMVTADDYLYFGRYKSFSMVYVELSVANINTNVLDVEYYNGSAWVNVSKLVDDTKGFTRSASISWDLPTDHATVAVNSIDAYWIRLKPSADFSITTAVQGINIVFGDDKDLEGIYPGILNYKASTETTYILRHESSRNDIVQKIRNNGHRKIQADGSYADYDAWDLLDHEQVNRWSTYLTMHNIFSSLQSKEDGLYKQKADEYMVKASDAETSIYLTLDANDNGKKENAEKVADISSRRVYRS